jgi:predicted DsbA family dithiol-disulfide isomerase
MVLVASAIQVSSFRDFVCPACLRMKMTEVILMEGLRLSPQNIILKLLNI